MNMDHHKSSTRNNEACIEDQKMSMSHHKASTGNNHTSIKQQGNFYATNSQIDRSTTKKLSSLRGKPTLHYINE